MIPQVGSMSDLPTFGTRTKGRENGKSFEILTEDMSCNNSSCVIVSILFTNYNTKEGIPYYHMVCSLEELMKMTSAYFVHNKFSKY